MQSRNSAKRDEVALALMELGHPEMALMLREPTRGLPQRVFWIHYNKPESARQKRNVWTVHWKGVCIPAYDIFMKVPARTKTRKTQPKGIIWGKARRVTVDDDGFAHIE